MRMKRVLLTVIYIFLILPVAFSLNATNALATSKQQVRIGAFTASGYHHKSADGVISGYGYDYDRLLSQYAGWDVTYVEGSWTELLQMLENGSIDLLGFVLDTPERETVFDFGDAPAGRSTSCLITNGDNAGLSYGDITDFDGMTVVTQRSNANTTSLTKWSMRNGITLDVIFVDSYQEVYDAISSGKADMGLVTNFHDLTGFKIVATFAPSDFFYAVRKGNSALLQTLNSAQAKINAYYPTLEKDLYERYFEGSNGYEESFTKEETDYLAGHPVVRVVLGGRAAPYEYIDVNTGRYIGIIPDVLSRLTELTGIQFVYFVPEDRWSYLNNPDAGNVITTTTADLKAAEDHGVLLTQPFIEAKVSIVTKDGLSEIQSAAMGNDQYIMEHIRMNYPDATIQHYATTEERLDAVYSGKCTAAIMNSYEAEYYMAAGKYNLLHDTISSEIIQNIAFGVSPYSDPQLFFVLTKALQQISRDEYRTIINANLNYPGSVSFASVLYANPVPVIGGLLLLVVLIICICFLFIYNRSIHRKNHAIMEANQLKTDFFAHMSHDMRTPMNGILGLAALSETESDVNVLKSNITKIKRSGQYMLQLVNDMLEIQKFSSRQIEMNMQVCCVQDILDDIMEMVVPTAKEKGVNIVWDVRINAKQYAMFDPIRVRQVFVNLLSNAIKFTPPGGTVTLSAETLGREGKIDHDRFRVIDTGIGMSREFCEKEIFKPYRQEDHSIATRYGGAGLGLAVAKAIVDRAGGSLTVESEKGVGSCFTLLFDFVTVDDKPAEATEKKAGAAAKQSGVDILRGKRILLFEDHPLNAEITKKLLEKVGCIVTHAENGQIGLDRFTAAEEHSFDAILMDIRMPVMDGLTAAKAIRALDRTDAKSVPIIAVTANAYQEDVDASLAAGMNEHLAKPIVPKVLFETLEKQFLK